MLIEKKKKSSIHLFGKTDFTFLLYTACHIIAKRRVVRKVQMQKTEGYEKLNCDLLFKFHLNRPVVIYSSFCSLWAKLQKGSLWQVFKVKKIFNKKVIQDGQDGTLDAVTKKKGLEVQTFLILVWQEGPLSRGHSRVAKTPQNSALNR